MSSLMVEPLLTIMLRIGMILTESFYSRARIQYENTILAV